MNADDTMKFSASTSPVAEDSNTGGEASRRIRSFVRREGRMTRAQRRAFAECWARFGVDAGAAMLEPERLFGHIFRKLLEIGFGDGESLGRHGDGPSRWIIWASGPSSGYWACTAACRALDLSNLPGHMLPTLSRSCGSYRTKSGAYSDFSPTHGPKAAPQAPPDPASVVEDIPLVSS
ncbi:MAG: hypothetical protein R3F40_07415 [Candidatus Competibacteraceae bacterium]